MAAASHDTARAWLARRGVRDETRQRLRRTRSDLATQLDEIYERLTTARV